MKVVCGQPGTVLLAAKDESDEIFYASAMKARVGGRRPARADNDLINVEDLNRLSFPGLRLRANSLNCLSIPAP